jgi:hypothetical protein
MMFEKGVLRRTFGPKRDEIRGGWRKLHDEEFHKLYCSPNIIRMIKSKRMRWEWHIARMGTKGNAYRVLVGKPEGKEPLGRPRYMLEDNIKMDLREIGCGGTDGMNVSQDRDQWQALLNKVMNLRIP